MNFELSTEQEAIREAVQDLCSRFPESYWLERDARLRAGAQRTGDEKHTSRQYAACRRCHFSHVISLSAHRVVLFVCGLITDRSMRTRPGRWPRRR